MGSILLMVSIFLLIYPLSEVQQQGWQTWIFSCLLLSFVVLILFIYLERFKQKLQQSPLVDLSLFKHRPFVFGICSVLAIYLSMFAFFFILSYFLQYGLKYDTGETSLVFLPIGIGFFVTSIISSKIINKYGFIALKMGALCMSMCTFLLVFFFMDGAI